MKIKLLTPEQALAALKKDPEHCPYCGSDMDGEGVDIQDDSKRAQQECTCQRCCASFYLNYKFEDADFINGPDLDEDEEAELEAGR